MEKLPGKILEMALATPSARKIAGGIESGEVRVIFSSIPTLPLLVSLVYGTVGGPLVVALPSGATRFHSDLECFLPGDAFHLPGTGPGGGRYRPYDEAVGARLKAARALEEGKVAVVEAEALMEGIPARLREPWPLEIAEGSELELENVLRLLIDGGYRREYMVEGWGKFALRGGILDVFPSTAERPIRVELFGDRVESLREFNLVSQRSLGRLERAEILPATDTGAQTLPFRKPGDAILLAVDPEMIEARAMEFSTDTGIEPAEGSVLGGWGRMIELRTLETRDGGCEFPGTGVKEFRGNLTAAFQEWNKLIGSGEEVFLLLEGGGQIERALELWDEQGFHVRPPEMGVAGLSRGFRIPEIRLSVYTSTDILGRRDRVRPRHRVSSGRPVTDYAELQVGKHVVHADQGIGVYRGLVSRETLGVTREYLLIEYAGSDRLYVPTSQLSKVQRYVGSENPTVHRLRARDWHRVTRKARRSAERAARDLLQLYLERKGHRGFVFSPDTTWQAELEDSFDYEDTPDQAKAVRDVKEDMEAPVSMDRLVCGDVGYGKTEVAVRAAMKSAVDSKQTAVLVPTTVLAKQHFETFSRRLAPFPVRVEMLSRFLSPSRQKEVVEGLLMGDVDVVVGTHRLLQDDVSFRDIGLLVIDEEQKFGVAHKEKLRRLRRNVDTLTLTATPIPRTLQMSLSGVRDISIIDTPPEDRHPVSTYVGEFDAELVRHAVNYELARGGQVFYVHNRIESIDRVAERLRGSFPETAIAVAHGRMDEGELERVMLDFAEGHYSMLVCTTIVESGLDIPNVNTLVVDQADLLGLAQLYQIRGRVGRSGRHAYAYFFYPRRSALSGTAVARLATISEMTPLGSGMMVAMRDLEIRGAGNLLGAEQSGHVEAVGFEFYCQLLREAVDALKGGEPRHYQQASIELPIDAYIPSDYISDEHARVEIYRRLIATGGSDRPGELAAELEDRFGEPPVEVRNMMDLERMRLEAGSAGVEMISMKGDELRIQSRPKREEILKEISRLAPGGEIPGSGDAYIDKTSRTLFLKLRLGVVKNRQKELLKWLKSIIDDIIENQKRCTVGDRKL